MRKSEFSERRPLSARMRIWQSRDRDASAGKMKLRPILPALAIALLAGPAAAVPGGEIDTLTLGRYTCELPGDALGPRGVHIQEADFAIVFGSSYFVNGVRGTYLLTGDQVVFTSGPRHGERYHRVSQNFLRKQNSDGTDSDLRCVITNRTNTFAF